MKRIGLVGFFGWGNFGDELFVETYRRYLSQEFEVSVIHDLLQKPYFSRPLNEVVERYDAFVIGGGDLVIPWQLSELYWRKEYLAKPVILNSVGVPRWGGYNRDVTLKMREFVSHENVAYISARDPESADWITTHLKPACEVYEAPDMVCALDLPPAIKCSEATLGLVTRARRGGDDDYRYVEMLCQKAADRGYMIRQIILGSGATGQKDLAAANQFEFPGKETFFDEDPLQQCRAIGECHVLASMKFHGSVVATMYGIPSIVLSPTDKSRNFMRRIEREDLLSNLKDESIADHFSPFMARIPRIIKSDLASRARESLDRLRQTLYTT